MEAVRRVPVLSRDGEPLMPCRPDRARHLLKKGRAKAVWLPGGIFALRLTCDLRNPEVTGLHAGDDPGSRTTMLSVVLPRTKRPPEEVVSVLINMPRGEVRRRMEQRRMYRRQRRYRLRTRPARFDNRNPTRCRVCGRSAQHGSSTCRAHRGSPHSPIPEFEPKLPPSIREREERAVRVLAALMRFLPIRRVTVEVARLDLQRLRNPDIQGTQYQRGPRYGYDSTLSALAAAYGPRCAYCGRKGRLVVDHVLPRSRGGTDAWENLLPACPECNEAKGNRTPEEWGVKPLVQIRPPDAALRDAAWTQQGKSYLLYRLRRLGLEVGVTYGTYTAWVRRVRGVRKSHRTDAAIIAVSRYPDGEAPELPLPGMQLQARFAPARPRQRFRAERYPEGKRPRHAVRLSSGWARPVRVNDGVRIGPQPHVVPAGGRKGIPRRELVTCGDLVRLEGESGPCVVTAVKSRGTITYTRADGSKGEASIRRILSHRPRLGVVLLCATPVHDP